MSLYTKLFDVQQELPKLVKSSTANAGKYSYDFISLEDLLDVVKPLFAARKLLLSFPSNVIAGVSTQSVQVVDVETGEKVESQVEVVVSDSFQDVGKQLTYLRRYLLIGLLGTTAEKDTDGADVGGKVKPRTERRSRREGRRLSASDSRRDDDELA